jgi:transcriptional regulator GlxA family with amidase domain
MDIKTGVELLRVQGVRRYLDRGRVAMEGQSFRLSRTHAGLRRLQLWVATNGCLTLSLRQAAQIASLEPHYFSVVFHRVVGKSFQEWRRSCRVEVALRLIKSGEVNMSEIATLVGYRDRRSFERAVKDHTGSKPSSFRIRA